MVLCRCFSQILILEHFNSYEELHRVTYKKLENIVNAYYARINAECSIFDNLEYEITYCAIFIS